MIQQHYDFGISPIEYMRSTLSYGEYIGFLKGNIIKYLARAGKKGAALDDYRKAQVYMDELTSYVEFAIPE